MKFVRTLLAAAALTVSASAFAAPTTVLPGNETSLQDLLNGLFAPGTPTLDVNAHQAAESGVFSIDASGAANSRIVFELAGNKNSNIFGIYDPYNIANVLKIYNGADSQGKLAVLDIGGGFVFSRNLGVESATFTSEIFGYYLENASGQRFYSQAFLNANGDDQFIAFQGNNQRTQLPGQPGYANFGPDSYIFAFEDQPYSTSDKDFNDFVVYVESVSAANVVPEPGSLALLGLGLAGLAAASRRKQKQA